jgi:hypothetical protein
MLYYDPRWHARAHHVRANVSTNARPRAHNISRGKNACIPLFTHIFCQVFVCSCLSLSPFHGKTASCTVNCNCSPIAGCRQALAPSLRAAFRDRLAVGPVTPMHVTGCGGDSDSPGRDGLLGRLSRARPEIRPSLALPIRLSVCLS